MKVFVKICGLARAEDVLAAAELRPDALGFVFHPPSPRAVTPQAVADWTADLPPGLLKVGVFVDWPPERVADCCAIAGLDIAQLHGAESPETAARSWPRTWKALAVNGTLDERARAGWPCEALLLDTPGGAMPGGTGRAADWTRAAAFVQNARLQVILAGGLNPENVEAAVRAVSPWGVDTSSGVEYAPGRKDPARMKDFIALCRSL